jgi:hypothetical protein
MEVVEMSEEKVSRRGFAGWLGRVLAAGLLGGALASTGQILRDRGQDDDYLRRRRVPSTREYNGYSDRNDFNGALKDAIRKAERDWANGRDVTSWRLADVSGVMGGRAKREQLTVTIRLD